MAAVTSCENALYLHLLPQEALKKKKLIELIRDKEDEADL